MSDRTDVVYQYDGSFEGMLCCVFRAFYQREDPLFIFSDGGNQATFLKTVFVPTEAEKAARVLRSIPAKLGTDALSCVELAFLSCMEEKEAAILAFLRLGYQNGSAVMRMLAEPCVHKVIAAARNVSGEAHLFKGFVRFSEYGGALAAEIAPKNHVLPLLGRHFQIRMPEQSFLIFDQTRKLALVCSGGQSMILPMEQAQLPAPSERELFYRRLWTRFYDAVGIEGRANPKCRMTHMPMRFWANMTEFQPENRPATLPETGRRSTSAPTVEHPAESAVRRL
ncbi:MAG: TIGR03915 family putative DNA repair protein [Clostridia bacterium]|nr:TIGR03915 family putative DNA repair protein [Clostridia bacterium]